MTHLTMSGLREMGLLDEVDRDGAEEAELIHAVGSNPDGQMLWVVDDEEGLRAYAAETRLRPSSFGDRVAAALYRRQQSRR